MGAIRLYDAAMTTPADKYAALTAQFRAGLAGDGAQYQASLSGIALLLRRIVARRIPPAEAEDVVQEILISVHKARHTYDGIRPLMPWLMAIVQFRINDHLRKIYSASRRETVDIDTVADTLPEVTETIGEHESIDALLEGVPERERKILTLMHVEGFTARETGLKLGMKESAVKVAAHRAVKKLREKFIA